MSATLPLEMLLPKERFISDIQHGETAYASFGAVRANDDGQCFLISNADLRDSDSSNNITITRDGSGAFHLIVKADTKIIRLMKDPLNLAPVASITVVPARRP